MTSAGLDVTAVVTGAATGIGRALAIEAARRGASVVALDLDEPTETAELIRVAGGRCVARCVDVRDDEGLRRIASELTAGAPPVGLVCANAGVGAGGTIDTITADAFRSLLEVNVVGSFNTVKAFLPALRESAASGVRAAILLTGSEHSLGVPTHVPPMTAYTTSKHALLGLAACLQRDLASDGIGVTLLCPGYVRTERLRAYADASPAMAEVLSVFGQDAADVARCAFEAVAGRRFVAPTNPLSSDFVHALHDDVLASMDALR